MLSPLSICVLLARPVSGNDFRIYLVDNGTSVTPGFGAADGTTDVTDLCHYILISYRNRNPARSILHANQLALWRFINRLRVLFVQAVIKRISRDHVIGPKMCDGLFFGEPVRIEINPRHDSATGIRYHSCRAGKLSDAFIVCPGNLSFFFAVCRLRTPRPLGLAPLSYHISEF